MEEVHKDTAERILSQVPEDKRFFAVSGAIYSSLEDLKKGLPKLKANDYKYHVNEEKNDFASWIYDIIGDADLAQDLRKAKKKTEVQQIIKNRIEYLKIRVELNE